MTDVAEKIEPTPVPSAGLAARLIGVVFSPRDAYTAVVARPRALGALLVAALLIGPAQGFFMSTEVGQNALIEQQLGAAKALGFTVTPEMEAAVEKSAANAKYTTPIGAIIVLPIICAVLAGLLLALFTAV